MQHVLWNLLLAAIAVALAYVLGAAVRATRDRPLGPSVIPLAALGIAWLLMLPNTCYLFTEVRHLFWSIDHHDLWSRSFETHAARRELLWRLGGTAMYYAAGALTFGLAVRPIRDALRERGLRTWAIAPFFFSIVALGVYLGLFQRFNSWDVTSDPLRIAHHALAWVHTWRRLAVLALSGAALWVVFEVVDVWIDGALLRVRALRGASSP